MVRWGIDTEEINDYLSHDGSLLQAALGGATYTTTYRLLPIPQDQIDLTGADILIQNPGF